MAGGIVAHLHPDKQCYIPPPLHPQVIEQVNRSTRELIKNLLKRTLSRNTSACESIDNVHAFQSTCFIIRLFYQYSIYATEAIFKFRSELHRVQSCWFTLYKDIMYASATLHGHGFGHNGTAHSHVSIWQSIFMYLVFICMPGES